MNISLFKRSWIRYYKRGFGTGLFIMCFILVVDQFLDKPLFFSKITNLDIFLFIVSTIFFASCFVDWFHFFLIILTIATKENK